MEIQLNDLKDQMNFLFNGGLATDGLSPTREFKIYTGAEGMQSIERAILRENALDLLDWLFTEKRVDENQKNSLTSMLGSTDWENTYLAIQIIKLKHNGTTL